MSIQRKKCRMRKSKLGVCDDRVNKSENASEEMSSDEEESSDEESTEKENTEMFSPPLQEMFAQEEVLEKLPEVPKDDTDTENLVGDASDIDDLDAGIKARLIKLNFFNKTSANLEQCTEASTEAVTTKVDVYDEPKRDPMKADPKPSEKHHKNLMLAENLKQVPVLSTNKDAQDFNDWYYAKVKEDKKLRFQQFFPTLL
eukprot:GFUD01033532.1.p1 GENE.GFUD01033532.1~~GFUD01033532.1.p1  ORF type:complete len:200 (+),score=79.47 GFUD01033532.1:264-863(+)